MLYISGLLKEAVGGNTQEVLFGGLLGSHSDEDAEVVKKLLLRLIMSSLTAPVERELVGIEAYGICSAENATQIIRLSEKLGNIKTGWMQAGIKVLELIPSSKWLFMMSLLMQEDFLEALMKEESLRDDGGASPSELLKILCE